jgi:hypothetical protein
MYYDLAEIKFLENRKMELTFEDGKKGVVDFESYTKRGGLFSRLTDPQYFKKAYVDEDWKVLCWPDNLDIAPETLYQQATGQPLPAWMQSENGQHRTVM